MSDEIIRGLPAPLPGGETLLWQGSPQWRSFARQVFPMRLLTAYVALVLGWCVTAGVLSGRAQEAAFTALGYAGLAAGAFGLLGVLAWALARSTIYTITNRRLVIEYGIALPKAVNLPFATIDGASLREHADGSGDIVIRVGGDKKIAYALLWPHVRPRHMSRPQPMLRAVAEPGRVAQLLSRALAASADMAPRAVTAGIAGTEPAHARAPLAA